MPSQTLNYNVSYTIDSELIWSVEEYLVNYLTDIPLGGLGGGILSDKSIEGKIRIATSQMEGFLSIKIPKQRISEEQDFERDNFNVWGSIKANFLVNEVNFLEGFLSFVKHITYPNSWISIKRAIEKARMIHIVAGQNEGDKGLQSNLAATFTGRFPLYGFSNSIYIPNYWRIDYTTGFQDIPDDIQDVVGKIATMQILAILGDISFGAGIASKSISIDGLSQSINTTQSAENSLYSARVRQFQAELKQELPWLKNRYVGLSLAVM